MSLSRYQLASGENIFPAMAGARQRGGWLSSGAATCWLLALIWRGRSRDLTALPQKSGPSDAWEGDLLPPPPCTHTQPTPPCQPATHKCTDAQSQKEQSARVQVCSYVLSARICPTGLSVCRAIGKEGKWWDGTGVGRAQNPRFKWDVSREARSLTSLPPPHPPSLCALELA